MNIAFFSAFIFLSSVAQADSSKPSLLQDCDFSSFIEKRMPSERERFWIRSQDHEEHFLRAEREYDADLSSQAMNCFEGFLKTSFQGCDLAHISGDAKRYAHVPSTYDEFDFWKFSRYSYPFVAPVSKLREKFLTQLGAWLTSCFKEEALASLNHIEIGRLYDAVRGAHSAYMIPSLPPAYLDPHRVEMKNSCGHFGCTTTYRIHLNGIHLEAVYDSEDNEYELRLNGKVAIRRNE